MRKKLPVILPGVLAILCVLMIGLWVRSLVWRDYFSVEFTANRAFAVESALGQFGAWSYPVDRSSWTGRPAANWHQGRVASDPCHPADNAIGFKVQWSQGYFGLVVPHWFVAMLSATFAVAFITFRLHFAFSLRSLSIAITIVSILLGVITLSGTFTS
jgi:hypothetical protein